MTVLVSSGTVSGWERDTFSAAGFTHDTFRRGNGPGVIVVHELPGITPLVARFANEVVDAGFTVVLPSLLGTPGRPSSVLYGTVSMVRLCISREFTTWALNRTSPVIAWLRAVARALHDDVGGRGVGAVGMCFSGGFALGMMVDDVMVAPVVSQPSLPFAFGRAERRADLNLSPDDLAAVVQRATDGCQVLGLRFTDDGLFGTRFDTLGSLLGDAFIAVELPSPTKRSHSVLTEHRDESGVTRVIEFLRVALLTDSASGDG